MNQKRGFTLIELLVVIVIIGILASIALPNYIKVKDKAKEAEVKANMHNHQIIVERFAVDNDGTYPSYLIGGDTRVADVESTNVEQSSVGIFTNISPAETTIAYTDPLLREGYTSSYSKNPFARNGSAIYQFQQDAGDPLRAGAEGTEGRSDTFGHPQGLRFGADNTVMGQMLADFRFPRYKLRDPSSGEIETPPSHANQPGYKMFDLWLGNQPRIYLPGEFFYKSAGALLATEERIQDSRNTPIQPVQIDQYIMGGYGSVRTKGSVVLGEERPVEVPSEDIQGRIGDSSTPKLASSSTPDDVDKPTKGGPSAPGAGPGGGGGIGGGGGSQGPMIWPWTRSETDTSNLRGSPYSPRGAGEVNLLAYGNTNTGVRDAIVIVLNSGEDAKIEKQ